MSISSRETVPVFTAGLLVALLCATGLGSLHARAQVPATAPDTSRYVTRTWTTEDGLPQNTAWALEQDDEGYLWIGTLEGLIRFDGHSFHYRLVDGPWSPAQSRRTAEFTTLGTGTHQFDVQATIDGETSWYTLDTLLRFTVAPRFYETGWFRLLVGLSLLGLMGGWGLPLRTRALRRRPEQLSRMVDERTAQLAAEKQKTERQAECLEALDAQKNRFFSN